MTILYVVAGAAAVGLGLTACKRGYGVLDTVINDAFDIVENGVDKLFKRG